MPINFTVNHTNDRKKKNCLIPCKFSVNAQTGTPSCHFLRIVKNNTENSIWFSLLHFVCENSTNFQCNFAHNNVLSYRRMTIEYFALSAGSISKKIRQRPSREGLLWSVEKKCLKNVQLTLSKIINFVHKRIKLSITSTTIRGCWSIYWWKKSIEEHDEGAVDLTRYKIHDRTNLNGLWMGKTFDITLQDHYQPANSFFYVIIIIIRELSILWSSSQNNNEAGQTIIPLRGYREEPSTRVTKSTGFNLNNEFNWALLLALNWLQVGKNNNIKFHIKHWSFLASVRIIHRHINSSIVPGRPKLENLQGFPIQFDCEYNRPTISLSHLGNIFWPDNRIVIIPNDTWELKLYTVEL